MEYMRFDVKLTDRTIFLAIARLKRPCSQVEIARRLSCSEATIIRSVRRLRANQWISVKSGGGYVPYTYEIHKEKLPEDLRNELESF